MDQNEDTFVRHMNDVPFQKVVRNWMASEAYRRLRSSLTEESDASAPIGESNAVAGLGTAE
jgi:hypothetical protein